MLETDAGRMVHSVAGANHFLHPIEHVGALVRAGTTDREGMFPAEDGVANVATCVAIADACRAGRAIDVART